MKAFVFSILLFLVIHLPAQEIMPDSFPDGKRGLRSLASYLLEAGWEERIRLTYELLPTKEEYQAVFQQDKLKVVQKFHKKWYRKITPAIGPRFESQNQILIEKATTEQLISHQASTQDWPGGYREMQDWLQQADLCGIRQTRRNYF